MRKAIVSASIVAAVITVAVPLATGQITTTSVSDGDWNNPATWDNGVPGALDTAVIDTPHTVWLASAGVPASPSVLVSQINVLGTLLSDSSVGQSMTLRVETINIAAGGVVMGQNGGMGPGGSVTIEPAIPGMPLNINNDGAILGGNGVCGGNILLYGNDSGSDLAAPNTTITSNGGMFRAGESGGSIWMAAGTITLNSAIIRGGDVIPAGPSCGLGGQAGQVYISAINAELNGATTVSGGDDVTFGPGIGGGIFIRALNDLFIDAPSSVLAGSPSGPACPGVLTFAGGTSTILGTVSPGPGIGCYVWDPPTLIAMGDMNVNAGEIYIGGQTFDVTGLSEASAPHFNASGHIEINLSPGGVLDTTGLTPGVPYFAAPQVIVYGDVVNANGNSLEDFVDGQVVYFDARVWRDIALSPGGSFYTAPGQTVRIPVQAVNVGAQGEQVILEVSDSMGWMTPISEIRNLPMGFTIYRIVELVVPDFAAAGAMTIVSARAYTTDGVLTEESFSFVEVIGGSEGPCNPADLAEPFGVLDLQDISAFIAGFMGGDPDLADLNNDGVLDLTDIGIFIDAFLNGCP